MGVIRISSKGQLVLPKEIRERLGLKRGRQVKVELVGDNIILEPVPERAETGWRRWGGAFRKTGMLEQHLAEHRLEVDADEKGI